MVRGCGASAAQISKCAGGKFVLPGTMRQQQVLGRRTTRPPGPSMRRWTTPDYPPNPVCPSLHTNSLTRHRNSSLITGSLPAGKGRPGQSNRDGKGLDRGSRCRHGTVKAMTHGGIPGLLVLTEDKCLPHRAGRFFVSTSRILHALLVHPLRSFQCWRSGVSSSSRVWLRQSRYSIKKSNPAQQGASPRPSSRTVGGPTVFLPVGKGAQVVGDCLAAAVGRVDLVAVGVGKSGCSGPEGLASYPLPALQSLCFLRPFNCHALAAFLFSPVSPTDEFPPSTELSAFVHTPPHALVASRLNPTRRQRC